MDFGDKIVYQVYSKSFMDSNGNGCGDLKGIVQKLDYLQELAVDYLWLTPVFLSPLRDNGYDIADYCKIDPIFGSMKDMEELIAEGTRRNIGIMLDMVFNHTSTEHEWFQKALAGDKRYQNYYFFKEGDPQVPPTNWISKFGGSAWEYEPSLKKWYLHLFDVSQADLNWDNPEVREELKKVIRFWKEKGVKGFRFDVINLISKPEIFENDLHGSGKRLYTDGRNVHDYLKEMVKDTDINDYITVGEMSSTTLEQCILYSNPAEKELSMCFNFHHLKADYKNGNKWELMEPDRRALKEVIENWQLGMQKGQGRSSLFWSNHDQPRIVSRYGNDQKYWRESAKMLAATMYLLKGTPYIYQGEEIGMTNAYYENISEYKDVESLNYYEILLCEKKTKQEALNILSARSRDNSRTPMQWTSEKNAGFTTGTPWISVNKNSKNINVEDQRKDSSSIYSFYKELISLRKKNPTIAFGDIEFLEKENADIFAFKRTKDSQEVIVLSNLITKNVTLPLQSIWSKYRVLLSNYLEHTITDTAVTLKPYETIVLEKVRKD